MRRRRRLVVATVAAWCIALVPGACGNGGAGSPPAHVLLLASADPVGLAHDPAVAVFVDRVARLSGGRLRIALDERWGRSLTAREVPLLRDVARGGADLGWAHASSFDRLGVHSFEPLLAPLVVDRDAVQDAVVAGPVGASMLAGVRQAGVEGLALLAGPFSRLVGAGGPARGVDDLRATLVAVHDSALVSATIRAWQGSPRVLSGTFSALLFINVDRRPGQPTGALERDLDRVFFDRYGGPCEVAEPPCAALVPWVTTNVVLWPRPAVLVANPARLRRLSPRERAWVLEAAAQATRFSLRLPHEEARTMAELCAAGVRFTVASPGAVAALREASRRVVRRRVEARTDTRAALRAIRRLRARAPAVRPLRPPPGCASTARTSTAAHGVPTTLPDGVYRTRITEADLRATRDPDPDDRPGVATLTLRRGRWRLVLTEPARAVRTGTYAGTALRTTWATDGRARDEAYVSIEVGGDGALRFRIGGADRLPSVQAIYASHPWRRIGP